MTWRFNAQVFWTVLATGVATAILLVVSMQPAQSAAAPAKMSDSFVDTIGVNTHFRFLDTAYNDKYPLVKEKLADLGVRHVRDGAFISSNPEVNNLVYGRYRELAGLGIRYNLIVDPRKENLETINAAKIATIKEMIGPSLESFEGPNEYNLTGSPTWAQDLTNYQKDLYPAVKSNPSTSNIPVIAPALGRPYPSERPDLRAYADYGNMHSYSGGKIPSDWGLENYIIPASRAMTGTKPIIATETGYHNAGNWTSGHPGISEKAIGKYMPRLMFEYFNRDVPLTHSYELIDQKPDPDGVDRSDNFGLLRYDGTEKPAYKALDNLIDLLQDPGPSFQPKSLDYSLTGATTDVHRTLLQKRDGRFYLVLWREASSYNLDTKQDIAVPSQKVTLSLNQPVSQANIYLPNRSLTPTNQYASPRNLTLYVPDEPLVIELKPSGTSQVPPRNSAPVISKARPGAGSATKDRTPTVTAKVYDRETNLSKSNTKLYVYGGQKNFSYNQGTNKLTFKAAKKQSPGRYKARIVTRDPQGLTETRRWTFRIKR